MSQPAAGPSAEAVFATARAFWGTDDPPPHAVMHARHIAAAAYPVIRADVIAEAAAPLAGRELDDARTAVQRSDRLQGTAAELSSIRDALRALIQHAENLEEAIGHLPGRAAA